MTPLEAFEYITTLSVDSNGKLHIKDMEKYLESCRMIENAIEDLRKTKDTLRRVEYDLGFLLKRIYLEEVKDIGMISPEYKIGFEFNPLTKTEDCTTIWNIRCDWNRRNGK